MVAGGASGDLRVALVELDQAGPDVVSSGVLRQHAEHIQCLAGAQAHHAQLARYAWRLDVRRVAGARAAAVISVAGAPLDG
jgi:hypothetical protein